ncbi:MAG: type II secretion system F family protein [Sedimentibacter saalensis]|uniref:type II secretion system F family protein n=1 Tax=Sedimentibacter saalensis TaxID=130788 RepID=UPI002B1FBA18|nr:type II secretion system F family protein [Sedimentibacter saalensis]MEA5095464.1 type II secretion system F family protein [Sedimentibacter saalensis]
MTLYKCRVFNGSGERHLLKIDGYSEEDILAELRKNNFIVTDIKKHRKLSERIHITQKSRKIKLKELSIFCRQMNSMLKSGISIEKCIEILSIQTEERNFSTVLKNMHKCLLTGSTFSEAVESSNEVFTAMFLSMVQAGELSGNLELVMERLAVQYGKEYKTESKVKSAMTYPVVLAVVATVVVVFLLIYVMPTFVDLYESSGVTLPYVTRILLMLSSWLKNYWQYIALVLLISVLIISRVMKNINIRYKIDSLKLRIPLYRTLKVKLDASRFARTLSTLVKSGVPLLSGLEAVSAIVGNECIKSLILCAREDVRKGSSLSYSIESNGVFPPMVYNMVKIGEESGELEDILNKTADFYDEEVENTIQKLVALIEPAMIVLMAVIIGFIMLAMVTPMFDMVNTVQ